jgi:hypothetical protein
MPVAPTDTHGRKKPASRPHCDPKCSQRLPTLHSEGGSRAPFAPHLAPAPICWGFFVCEQQTEFLFNLRIELREEYRVAPATVMTNTLKDVLPLTADLTTVELAEALAGLRFQNGSSCLVSVDKDVRDYLLRAIETR